MRIAHWKRSLPAHRLVGELSHPVELLLHLVFSARTPTRGKYSALFLSTRRSVLRRGAAQNPGSHACRHFPSLQTSELQSQTFPLAVTSFQNNYVPPFFSYLDLLLCLRRDAGPIRRRRTHTRARTHRQSSSDKKRLRSNAMWEMECVSNQGS